VKKTIYNYFSGISSDEELKLLLEFLRTSEENRSYFAELKDEWENDPNRNLSFASLESWKKIKSQLRPVKYRFRNFSVWATSAAALLVVIIGMLVVFNYMSRQQVVIRTAEGQQMQLYLPDSTHIYLNDNSSISYNQGLYFLNKEVNLRGEAYFEVAHQKNGNFKVNVGDLNVIVLGTRFNVSEDLQSDYVEVILKEGVVELSMDGNDSFQSRMHPGQRATVMLRDRQVSMSEVDASICGSWKEGVVYCRNMRLEVFCKEVEKRYGVSINIENDKRLRDLKVNYTIKKDPLDQLLHVIEIILPVNIQVNDSNINITLNERRYELMRE